MGLRGVLVHLQLFHKTIAGDCDSIAPHHIQEFRAGVCQLIEIDCTIHVTIKLGEDAHGRV